jgi:hypothetical protein
MKTFKQTILYLATILLFISCSKDDNPAQAPVVYNEENPLQAFLTSSGFNQVSTPGSAPSDLIAGMSFKPTVKGKINAILVTLPLVNNNLKVSFWDNATGALLQQEIVNVSSANTEFVKLITPLQLEKDKTYVISMQTNSAYVRSRADQANAPYPVTAGNIQILAYREGTNLSAIPSLSYYNAYGGDCSFKFQQTE